MTPNYHARHSPRLVARVCFAATLAVSAGSLAQPVYAQRAVSSVGGTELRYLGDTIWRVRDTTMTRAILRGDTVVRTNYVHGILTSTVTFVQRGDDAEQTVTYPAPGAAGTTPAPRTRVPMMVAIAERQMLEQAMRAEQLQARMPSTMRQNITPDESPATPREYRVSANTTIVQHRDTVRYVHGCAAAPPVDTVVYVLFGADSVRRRSPDPRTFDRHMVSAIRADMSTTMTREQVAARVEAPAAPLPSLRRWPCDRR